MTSLVLAFEILRLMNAPITPRLRERAAVAAVAIAHAAAEEKVDTLLLAAVAMKESSYRQEIVGKAGEIGMFQIKPGRKARTLCDGLNLYSADDNARCGARYLAVALDGCGWATGLRRYNGSWQTCAPSLYAERVLRIMRRAGKPVQRGRATKPGLVALTELLLR